MVMEEKTEDFPSAEPAGKTPATGASHPRPHQLTPSSTFTSTRSRKPSDKSPSRHGAILSPRDYAGIVDNHAGCTTAVTLHPGHNLQSLAVYLQRPFQKHATVSSAAVSNRREAVDHYVSLYNLGKRGASRVSHLHSPQEIEDVRNDLKDEHNGKLLFLRGHMPPDWLNSIGSTFRVDPDFLSRHLSFQSVGAPHYYPLPSLPSAYTTTCRLRLTTIGSRMLMNQAASGSKSTQDELDRLRKKIETNMQNYLETLSKSDERKVFPGDSIVRHFSAIDGEHFSFEQDISIGITHVEDRWRALIWLDVGNDLHNGPDGPWRLNEFLSEKSQTINYFPTLQPKAGVAFGHVRIRSNTTDENDPKRRILQTASLLHLDYGRHLDPRIEPKDPFYALQDVFRLVAFSEVQFLNLLEDKIRREVNQFALIKPRLSNLLYMKQIIQRHCQYNSETIRFIEGLSESYWPTAPGPEGQEKRVETVNTIDRDFQYLLKRAEALCAECDRGMDIVMNNVMIKESQNGIRQAEEVTKLTKLAFFFIPISFTSTFFGMNVQQLVDGASQSIWVWAVATVGILLVSFAFLIWDVRRLPSKIDLLRDRSAQQRTAKLETMDEV